MIRPIIKEQLDKCQFADLNNYDPGTNTFYIRKYSKPTYEINHCYLVRLPLNIVDAPDSVLAVNWNNGSCPKTQYLKIYVSRVLGNMIQVDSISYNFETRQDLNLMWSGWLDINTLAQITAL